ncbi:response regulator transcription factor [Microlunatus parietis]|uniref:DNA-binding NarL/FixJ family response regulator n=1 Tax=Microlunatus parietis TaxID=682979 RepID=A0A7Y9LAI3_9ACTN|nr:response regulator transcription factor [Microlunatus parietis]NYE69823.1 DNA-binding NarL/FixJ family response regulator [Microlunatus parietis]
MRLIIGEDEGLLREGLSRLLTDEGYDVVATASTATELVAHTLMLRPRLVITDIRMPPGNARDGIEAALSLRASMPDLAVLVLSQHVDSAGATELLTAGARGVGYLLKQRLIDVDPFLQAVQEVLDGGTVIDSTVVDTMMKRSRPDNEIDRLSPRRRETLALMAEGMSNSRIAAKLVVTDHAVARNISAIFDTLGLPPSPDDHRRVLAVLKYLDRQVR